MKKIIKFFVLLFCFGLAAKAQTNQYRYQNKLSGHSQTWHSIQLPSNIFKYAQSDLKDVRIFGFKGKDTLQVPFVFVQQRNQITQKEVAAELINQSSNANGYFYTFKAPKTININQINLNFKQTNFNWLATLEGSNDNNEWFTLLKDYRILSIQNNSENYKFCILKFGNAKYNYFRVNIKANEQPNLTNAKILQTDTLKGNFTNASYTTKQIINDTKNKETMIKIGLAQPTPIAYLKIEAIANFDFYRPIKIECATDSFKTDRGIQYNYTSVYEGTISSLENGVFDLNSTLCKNLKITVSNNDNPPLHFKNFSLTSPVYQLTARFDKPDYQYAIFYGNSNAEAPNYELANYLDKIPTQAANLIVGPTIENPKYTEKTEKPLLLSKTWLWAVMLLAIVIMGFFAFKMLKN